MEDMAVRLYEARRVLRDFWGSQYPAKVQPWREAIREAMARTHNPNAVAVMLAMVAGLKRHGELDGMVMAMLLAAAVEEIETPAPTPAAAVSWLPNTKQVRPRLSKKEAKATPLAFRDLLLSLAQSAAPRGDHTSTHQGGR